MVEYPTRFQSGSSGNPKGRPKGAVGKWRESRERIIKELSRRNIKTITTQDLLKAYIALSPKETKLSLKPDIDFISEVPRPQVEAKPTKKVEHTIAEVENPTQPQQGQEVKESPTIEEKKFSGESESHKGGPIHPATSSNFTIPLNTFTQSSDGKEVREPDYYLDKNGNKVLKNLDDEASE